MLQGEVSGICSVVSPTSISEQGKTEAPNRHNQPPAGPNVLRVHFVWRTLAGAAPLDWLTCSSIQPNTDTAVYSQSSHKHVLLLEILPSNPQLKILPTLLEQFVQQQWPELLTSAVGRLEGWIYNKSGCCKSICQVLFHTQHTELQMLSSEF